MKANPGIVLKRLGKAYAHLEPFSARNMNAFQCLVGTVLSARTRDEQTAKASNALFKVYPTARKLANAPLKKIQKLIKPVGFYRTKSKYVKKLAQQLLRDYGGKVPNTMEELVRLPGVGRKVAGCVLVYAFKIPAIPVDSHVAVVSRRLGWTKAKDPLKVELDLMKSIPKKDWVKVNELLVLHGQKVCLTQRPKCEICPLTDVCRYYQKNIAKT